MQSETLFLQPIVDLIPNPNPNFARATGNGAFFNYSHSPSGSLTDAQAETLVTGGVALAIAEAQALFITDPAFSFLFTDSSAPSVTDGTYTGSSQSNTKVVANFTVQANQTFSFDFSANLGLTAKEIENRGTEYNQAKSKTSFLVLDTTNPDCPRILDYFGIQGNLITSEKIGNVRVGRSRNVTITSQDQMTDIDGNNGTDFVNASAVGTYQRQFSSNTNITVVEINESAIEVVGDNLIGNLGTDVIYGTISNDNLLGTDSADKIYGSFGDDWLFGLKSNDILEGGQGNDWLFGGKDDDKLNGGSGNDILTGGSGNDILVGGDGNDKFIFYRSDTFLRNDFDVIQDFQIGVDKIVLQGWGNINIGQYLQQGNITDTNDGVLLKFNSFFNKETLLISGISSSEITSESFIFI